MATPNITCYHSYTHLNYFAFQRYCCLSSLHRLVVCDTPRFVVLLHPSVSTSIHHFSCIIFRQADVPLGKDSKQKSTTWFNLALTKALLLLFALVGGLLKKDTVPATTEDISTTIIMITSIFFPLILIMCGVQLLIPSIYI